MGHVVDLSDRALVERQAREWLVRLDADDPLSQQEGEALRAWINRSPAHRAELTRLSKYWGSANVLTELAVPLQPGATASQHRSQPRAGMLAAAACVVLALAGVASWLALRPSGVGSGSFGTAIGQQRQLALTDGSSVQLNTDSQIQVSYGDDARRIRLLRGEALFTVARDASRPFEVIAAGGVVRALGTAFSVRLDGENINVAVTHGTVEVTSPEEPSSGSGGRGVLQAGDVTTFVARRGNPRRAEIAVEHLPDQELQRRLAWQDGYLVFAGQPLSEVVEELNRYSPTPLRIASPGIETLTVGGRFRVGDLDAVLDVLRTSFGIQATAAPDGSLRLESAEPR
jgi:transmembrane sensor